MPDDIEQGHGPTPWHCTCHPTRTHAVPSLAAECERTTQEGTRP